MLWKIFIWFGWIPITFIWLKGFFRMWVLRRQQKWSAPIKRVLLAIDIPRGNAQTLKAVENMFTYFGGLHDPLRFLEKYWEGKFQLSISMEIISIGGYIQFLIRVPETFRELIETAVYSQYPDAEITEVNDYTEGAPTKFPDDEYDVYGNEFIHSGNDMFPIKTYPHFEDQTGETEVQYKDPTSALMDMFSSLQEGEQYWYQIVLIPEGFDWPKLGEQEIKKILKEKKYSDRHIGDKIVDKILKWMEVFSEFIYNLWGDLDESRDESLKMLELNPIEKKKVEAISEKTAKLGFRTTIRFVYLAKKDIFNRSKAISGSIGYMKQFVDMHLNGIMPDTKFTMTRAGHLYFLQKMRLNWKKNNIVRNYINRSPIAGRGLLKGGKNVKGIFNIEELATLWNFPMEQVVKAPLLQKVLGKKSEPPASLPTTEELSVSQQMVEFEESDLEMDLDKEIPEIDIKTSAKPPDNLPIA